MSLRANTRSQKSALERVEGSAEQRQAHPPRGRDWRLSSHPRRVWANRYTECRLQRLARDSLLTDVALDTVDFTDNFDASEREPMVLPARLPMLLLNGASGIAVGMATNMPPHNLGEPL